MSLDITLYSDKTCTDTIAEMNWLRNPFGLERWIRANVDPTPTIEFREKKWTLWDVCNEWSYDKGEVINAGDKDAQIYRQLFHALVEKNVFQTDELRQGFFNFRLSEYMSFVQPKFNQLPTKEICGNPRIIGAVFQQDGTINIPMEYFAPEVDGMTLPEYQVWAGELLVLSEFLVKDPHTYLSVIN